MRPIRSVPHSVSANCCRVEKRCADDARSVLIAAIKRADGFLPLTDRSSPDAIGKRLGISKKAFKRALGNLYKARKVELSEDGIQWIADAGSKGD